EKLPWSVLGMPIRRIAFSIATVASLSDFPGGKLKEIVVATNMPWWLTAIGVLPCSQCANAESGTMLSAAVDTGAPLEAIPLPTFAMELFAWFLAESSAMLEAVAALLAVGLMVLVETVPGVNSGIRAVLPSGP